MGKCWGYGHAMLVQLEAYVGWGTTIRREVSSQAVFEAVSLPGCKRSLVVGIIAMPYESSGTQGLLQTEWSFVFTGVSRSTPATKRVKLS